LAPLRKQRSTVHSGQLARLSASIAERRNLRWRTSGQAPVKRSPPACTFARSLLDALRENAEQREGLTP
jgi:hypothetical protein